MTSTTARLGITKPNSSDPLPQGADTIAAAMDQLDNLLTIAPDSKLSTDAYTTYPLGVSLMQMSATGAANSAWPDGSGMVLTMRRAPAGDVVHQVYLGGVSTTTYRWWLRLGGTGGWGPWRYIAGHALPVAVATGQVTGTPPAGGVVALNVSFPASRFSTGPRVVCSINGSTTPQAASASAGSVTSTGMVVYLYRTTATGTSVAWQAIEGVE